MLYLLKSHLPELFAHAQEVYPQEACGILAGKFTPGDKPQDGRTEKVYPMTNTDKSAASFFMDARQQLRVLKEIRNLGLEMVGIYHSHPRSTAYPSAHDVELAFYPEVSYAIVSLQDRDRPQIRSFRIVDGRISEEQIRIE